MKNKPNYNYIKDKLKNNDLLWFFIYAFVIALATITELSLMNILFSYCIPWMYYGFSIIIVIDVLVIMHIFTYKRNKEEKYNYSWVLKIALWLIIITAFVALPNRFIPIDDTKVITGKVVDKTKWKLLSKTTGGWQNYVKIKIDGEDTFFWYNLDYENKEYGTRCLISERKGIWGLHYVTNVDFIVE